MTELETDYLIVGSGAMGMAADTLLAETKADKVIVDRPPNLEDTGMSTLSCVCINLSFFGVGLAIEPI